MFALFLKLHMKFRDRIVDLEFFIHKPGQFYLWLKRICGFGIKILGSFGYLSGPGLKTEICDWFFNWFNGINFYFTSDCWKINLLLNPKTKTKVSFHFLKDIQIQTVILALPHNANIRNFAMSLLLF